MDSEEKTEDFEMNSEEKIQDFISNTRQGTKIDKCLALIGSRKFERAHKLSEIVKEIEEEDSYYFNMNEMARFISN